MNKSQRLERIGREAERRYPDIAREYAEEITDYIFFAVYLEKGYPAEFNKVEDDLYQVNILVYLGMGDDGRGKREQVKAWAEKRGQGVSPAILSLLTEAGAFEQNHTGGE